MGISGVLMGCEWVWQAKKDNLGGLQDEQARLKAEYDRMEVPSYSFKFQNKCLMMQNLQAH
jgi:hypothetical protein